MGVWQKKTAALILSCIIGFTAICVSGCSGDKDYPVTVGNVKFDKEPEKFIAGL